MPNNLTDYDIKKALECCVIAQNCNGCPHYDNGKIKFRECLGTSIIEALDLINRLETENKGLRDEIEHLHETIDDLHETIEGWDI